MTISSWMSAALASLLSSTVVVSGQRIILLPAMSSSPHAHVVHMHNNNMGLLGSANDNVAEEPPCRQRRLEPWRQYIREQCRVEAIEHCSRSPEAEEGERDATIDRELFFRSGNTSPFISSGYYPPSFTSMEREIDSFFSSMFASPSQEAEDPIENLFNSMVGFSLHAFDQLTMMEDAASVSSSAGSSPSHDPPMARSFAAFGDDGDGDDEEDDPEPVPVEDETSGDEDPMPPPPPEGPPADNVAPATAEEAAENALDLLVTKLMTRSSSIHSSPEDSSTVMVDNLPQRLYELGNSLLSETHSRRRLMEVQQGDDEQPIAVDPHLQVKERIGRRLTEYRNDLFAYPDGTITLYRSSSFPSSSMMMMAPPQPPSFVSSDSERILGMGSNTIDECIKSRYDNGDLMNGNIGCHDAVEQFLLAIDDRTRPRPHPHLIVVPNMRTGQIQLKVLSDEEEERAEFVTKNFPIVMTLAGLFVLLFVNYCASSDDDEDEYDDDSVASEVSDGEFDYARLPEDDGKELPAREEGSGNPRVFVGVPVQVV